jgi:hypothetical protein
LVFGFKDTNTRELSVALSEVETVADDELVGDFETHEVCFEFNCAAGLLVE